MLAEQSILGCRFFPFITLNILCHSPLAYRVYIEKSADSLMGVPLYVVTFLLLLLIFYLSLIFCQFDYYVSQCAPSWVYPAWDSLCFLDLVDYFLSHVGEAFSCYLFKYFLGSFLSFFSWDPYNVNVDAFNVVPEVSYAVIIFFSFFFLYSLLWQ